MSRSVVDRPTPHKRIVDDVITPWWPASQAVAFGVRSRMFSPVDE